MRSPNMLFAIRIQNPPRFAKLPPVLVAWPTHPLMTREAASEISLAEMISRLVSLSGEIKSITHLPFAAKDVSRVMP